VNSNKRTEAICDPWCSQRFPRDLAIYVQFKGRAKIISSFNYSSSSPFARSSIHFPCLRDLKYTALLMYRLRPLSNGILKNTQEKLLIAPSLKLLKASSRQSHNGSRPKEPFNPAPGYAGFAVIVGSIASYSLYELYTHRTHTAKGLDLNQRTFVSFLITTKEQVSPTSTIFTLRRSSRINKEPYAALWARNIWSVEFKQPQLQIARSYTPLPPTDTTSPSDLRFLIRKEHNGEVSNYLDRLQVGETIDVRGPRVEYKIPEGVSEVLFLAGGTGIAPAMQTITALMKQKDEEGGPRRLPNLHIIWANRRRNDCVGGVTRVQGGSWLPFSSTASKTTLDATPNILVKELGDMVAKYEGHLTIDYVVDEERSYVDRKRILQTIGKDTDTDAEAPSVVGSKLLMISGPEGFIEHLAGPRALENGVQVQGPVRGVIGKLGLQDWSVVKL
jgi:cytochrome-b5 reductase